MNTNTNTNTNTKQQEATMNLETIKAFIINYMESAKAAKLEADIQFAKAEQQQAEDELEAAKAAKNEAEIEKLERKVKGLEADIAGMINGKAAKAEAEAEKQAEAEKAEALAEAEKAVESAKAENNESAKALAEENVKKAELKIKGLEADIDGMNHAKAEKAEAEAEKQAEAEKAEALDKAELEALESAAKSAKAEAVKQALEKAVNDKKAEIESKAEAAKAAKAEAEAKLFSEAVVYCFPEFNLAAVKIAKVTAHNTAKAAKASSSNNYTYNDAIAEALAGGKSLKAGDICKAIETAGKLESINTNPEGWKRAVSTALLNTNKYARNENHEYSLLG